MKRLKVDPLNTKNLTEWAKLKHVDREDAINEWDEVLTESQFWNDSWTKTNNPFS